MALFIKMNQDIVNLKSHFMDLKRKHEIEQSKLLELQAKIDLRKFTTFQNKIKKQKSLYL